MRGKKRIVRKLPVRKRTARARRPPVLIGRDKTVFVNLIRDVCYRYGIAMARFEFKGKMPKPSVDEFRERIVHHMNVIENSLKEKLSKNAGKRFDQVGKILSTKLKFDVDRITNGINLEVDNIYELV